MNKLISIIVPIYNVELYLKRCIDSILNQTYTNSEIILVDDGSLDNCPQICDDYEKKDSRIKVIHKENGGLSEARNVGLKMASGDYISFIDSDDYIDNTMYEKMINKLLEYNADIVECGTNYVYDNQVVKYKGANIEKECNAENALKGLILGDSFQQTVWNKIYKKNIIQDILFEKGKINEEDIWTYIVFSRCNKLVSITEPLYFYIQRANSIMGQNYSIKRLDGVEARYRRLIFIKNNYYSLYNFEKKSFFFYCLYNCQCILRCKNKSDKIKGYNIIQSYIKKIDFNSKEQSKMSLKEIVWIRLSKVSIKLTCIIRNKLGIGI